MKFSKRYGHIPIRETIQINSMDEELRNGIWSLVEIFYWKLARYESHYCGYGGGSGYSLSSNFNGNLRSLCNKLWFNYFKKPLDQLSDDWVRVLEQLRKYFFTVEWFEVYDFIEFVANNFPDVYGKTNLKFMSSCNTLFEKEMGGYRFVDGLISRIAEEEEIKEIESAITKAEQLVSRHLRRSLELLSDRSAPDYRNSIKESISAVERLVVNITGEKGTLGQLLKRLDEHFDLHPALRSAFSNIYGYTSDESGIRHALNKKKIIDFEDAKFMLVVCSAFINYVEGKMKERDQ